MFDDVFEVVLADTPASRTIHHKIRYHVYCVERCYEDGSAFPTGEERDAWDDDAVHFVVRERASGRCVAAMRLVLPRSIDFPVETLGCIRRELVPPVRRRECAEISRISLIRYPARWMYRDPLADGLGRVPKSREFEVLLGMLRAVWAYAPRRGISWCYLLVTDSFARLLRRVGVALHPVGDLVEHRGHRAPYMVDLRESAEGMRRRSPAVDALFGRKALACRRGSVIDPDSVNPDSLLIAPGICSAA